MLTPEKAHQKALWSPSIRSQWFRHFGLRDGCFLGLVTASILWFQGPLLLVLTSSQQDEHSQHYSYIPLIPFLCLYLLYVRRSAIFTEVKWNPLAGSILMAMGGAVSFMWAEPASEGLASVSPAMLSFVMICWGAFLVCYGAKAVRAASFELGLLVFMVPFPSFLLGAIVGFLQRSSTEATHLLFAALGVPVFREGFVFSLSNFTIHVAEECSGIRSALSLCIVSLVAGHLVLRSGWAKIGIVSIAVPLAIVKNAVRIVGLALLANYVDPAYITDSLLHRSGGIPLFALSLVVLFALIWALRKIETRFGYGSEPRVTSQ